MKKGVEDDHSELVFNTPTLHRSIKSNCIQRNHGEMAEWSIAHPWKGCKRATVSGVRIPLSPQPRANSRRLKNANISKNFN